MTETVFVIDDEEEVRTGLDRFLRSAGLDVVAHGSAHSFMAEGPYQGNGCILLDVTMPGISGPELHESLRKSAIDLPVIYLTGQATVSEGVRAIKDGAYDFLEKPVDGDTLLSVIEQALAAHRSLQVEHACQDRVKARYRSLSPREREVLSHVVFGRLNKQIASELDISEKTVKTHRGRGMYKMQCRSVADLVRDWGIIEASASR